MIPLRVTMSGWMRYRDEQVADFTAGNLISICGENGAGKSSIFDAITFALYGTHRLDNRHSELISDGKDRLTVEFEFEVDGARYSVRRSRDKLGRDPQQGLWRWDEAAGEYAAIAGTDKEQSLRAAIGQIVRLTPQAFMSSFMLQQGEATAFLDAPPAERFKIVRSLLGLEAYERIAEAARVASRDEKRRLDDLTQRLSGFEGIDSAAVERMAAEVEAARVREAAAAEAQLRARACLADAQRHARVSAEIDALNAQIGRAATLIAEREQIETDYENHGRIDAGIEHARRVQSALADAAREEAVAADSRGQAAAIDLETLAAKLAAAEVAASKQAQAVAVAEHKRAAAALAEREAHNFATIAEKVLAARTSIEECEGSIATFDVRLASLPGAEREAREQRAISDALPAFKALHEALSRLQAVEAMQPEQELSSLRERRDALHAQMAARQDEVSVAEADLREATVEAADRSAGVAVLADHVGARQEAAAESACSRCGQPIDKKRARAEVAELKLRLIEAQQSETAAKRAETKAVAALKRLRTTLTSATADLARLDREIVAAEARVGELARARGAVTEHRKAIPKSAPAAMVSGARLDDADALAALLRTHAGTTRHAEEATRKVEALRKVEGERDGAVAMLQRATTMLLAEEAKLNGRRGDVHLAISEHAEARQRLNVAEEALKKARRDAETSSRSEQEGRRALEQARARRTALDASETQASAAAAGHRQAAAAFASPLADLAEEALGDPAGVLAMLRRGLQQLIQAPARKKELDAALADSLAWTNQRAAKIEELAAMPEAHRVAEASAVSALEAADTAGAAARETWQKAQQRLAMLEARIDELARLQDERKCGETRHRHLNKLVRLLGKRGLQGLLIRDALSAITSNANAFLQRLTGGGLQLDLSPGDGDELELKAIDSDCMYQSRSVRALSGSQKFRCAVAIASGIGQYAGAGGMRSIVIDEGFGSLDPDGQRQMVEELKNLAVYMDRVIVVSHHEAFSERESFPERILVERIGTSSRISRMA